MKKTNLCLIVVLLLSSMVAFSAKRVSATAYTTVTLNPSLIDSWMYWGSGSGTGTVYTISVDVLISNVTGMAGWCFGLFWNNSALNCDNVAINNPSIWGADTINVTDGIENNYNSTNGHYCFAISAMIDCDVFNGTQAVATMTFHQLANVSSTTPLNLDENVEICDRYGNDIEFSATDGVVVMHTGAKPTIVTISGNGSTIQLSPWPANWTNWQCSQSNDSDTSYVCSSFEDSNPYVDLYTANCSWIPPNVTNIVATVHMVVRSTSTHKALCIPAINASSTGVEYGSSYSPSTTYEDHSSSFNITQSDGGTLQIGVEVISAQYRIGGIWHYYPGYCTEVYAIITWS